MRNILTIMFTVLSLCMNAQIKLQPMFSDNMVMQQKTNAPIWGEVEHKGAMVRVTTSWNKKRYDAIALANGGWKVEVTTPKAGGPYEISIEEIVNGKATSSLTLHNVLIGEVWLCTGQSNMEMPLAGWGKIDNYEEEIAHADNYPRIRIINMKHVISPQPRTSIEALTDGWEVCSSKSIPEFSAAGYFFAVNLQRSLNVPIGLIATNWGGTLAESWTSEESLIQMPYFRDMIEKVKRMPNDPETLKQQYEEEERAYWQEVNNSDINFREDFPWAQCDFNDSKWNAIRIPGKIEENGLSGFDGVVWLRRQVEIPTSWEGKPLKLCLGPIDDEDITFFNGKEIGRTGIWFAPRNYDIPANMSKVGTAYIAIRILDTGADGGLTTDDGNVYLACGEERISLAGEWKYKTSVNLRDFPPRPVNMAHNPNLPTVLYNSMLNPLAGYALRGAIWYQGESNTDRAYQYRELLPLMINDWRTKWNSQLDFYIVQLANFMKKASQPEESTWAELREAQMLTAQHLENTGIACAIDIGMEADIHPKNKQEVGRRLALAALAKTYNKKVAYSGPIYKDYRIEGNKIRLWFEHIEKGFAEGATSGSMTIAGADRKFYKAHLRIEGETIVVWADEVAFPVAVRYGWANNPDGIIYNSAGLPMFPFRTDNWEGITSR